MGVRALEELGVDRLAQRAQLGRDACGPLLARAKDKLAQRVGDEELERRAARLGRATDGRAARSRAARRGRRAGAGRRRDAQHLLGIARDAVDAAVRTHRAAIPLVPAVAEVVAHEARLLRLRIEAQHLLGVARDAVDAAVRPHRAADPLVPAVAEVVAHQARLHLARRAQRAGRRAATTTEVVGRDELTDLERPLARRLLELVLLAVHLCKHERLGPVGLVRELRGQVHRRRARHTALGLDGLHDRLRPLLGVLHRGRAQPRLGHREALAERLDEDLDAVAPADRRGVETRRSLPGVGGVLAVLVAAQSAACAQHDPSLREHRPKHAGASLAQPPRAELRAVVVGLLDLLVALLALGSRREAPLALRGRQLADTVGSVGHLGCSERRRWLRGTPRFGLPTRGRRSAASSTVMHPTRF